jgi:hypothetical protein
MELSIIMVMLFIIGITTVIAITINMENFQNYEKVLFEFACEW